MLETGQWTTFFGLFSEYIIHELTNAGFNILSYYDEEGNLSRIIHWLHLTDDLTDALQMILQTGRLHLTDDLHKPQCIFFSKVPGNDESISFVSSLLSIPIMCCRNRTLISGFISEDT